VRVKSSTGFHTCILTCILKTAATESRPTLPEDE